MNNTFPRTMTVYGEGKISAQPDIATVVFSITLKGKKVSELTNESKMKMSTLIEALTKAGIKSKDMTTNFYYLNPQYIYPRNKTPEMSGYQLDQGLRVKIRQLEQVDTILDLALETGVNRVGELNFLIDDEEKLQQQVREAAFHNAAAKAQSLAQASQLKLVRILTFIEGNSAPLYTPSPFQFLNEDGPKSMSMFAPLSSQGSGATGSSNLQSGAKELRASVTVTYEVE